VTNSWPFICAQLEDTIGSVPIPPSPRSRARAGTIAVLAPACLHAPAQACVGRIIELVDLDHARLATSPKRLHIPNSRKSDRATFSQRLLECRRHVRHRPADTPSNTLIQCDRRNHRSMCAAARIALLLPLVSTQRDLCDPSLAPSAATTGAGLRSPHRPAESRNFSDWSRSNARRVHKGLRRRALDGQIQTLAPARVSSS